MIPPWLHILSQAAVMLGIVCAVIIATDEMRRPQHMAIMNVVWPVVALFGTLLTLWAYFRYGTRSTEAYKQELERRGKKAASEEPPLPVSVGLAAAHCGSGCCLGDLCAEWLAVAVPAVAVAFGWGSLFKEKMFAVWILDFVLAFGFGILFQYFTIKPMRDLSVGEGLKQALKADTLSLTAWQVGMYGFMAVAQFLLFRGALHTPLTADSVEFWFMMQIAMLAGFATSYPVNWWLVQTGIKERM